MTYQRIRAGCITVLFLGLAATIGAQEHQQTWKGYLADQMCAFRWRGELAESYARRHALSCNFDEECMASGYGIMVGGTFIALSDSSSTKAIAYLRTITKKRNSIFVSVTGTLHEGKIEVGEIRTAEAPKD